MEWRPRQEDRLQLVTPEGEVQASVHVEGWTVTVAVRDAYGNALSFSPAVTPAGSMSGGGTPGSARSPP